MRNYRHELIKHLRYRNHVYYVEARVVELRNIICKQACKYGNVDELTRELYLKYNRYLLLLNP